MKQFLSKGQRCKGAVGGVFCLLLLMEYVILAIMNVSPTSDHRVLSQEPSNIEGCCMVSCASAPVGE